MQYKGYTIIVSDANVFIYSNNGFVTKTEITDEAYTLIDLCFKQRSIKALISSILTYLNSSVFQL